MEWLDRLRKFKDMSNETYKTISEKTDIPQTTIEKIFCGRTKDPKLNMMKSIVHCLGYTLDDLVEDYKSRIHLTKGDEALIIAYKSHPEMQPAIDKMLDIKKDAFSNVTPSTPEQMQEDISSDLADRINTVKSSV